MKKVKITAIRQTVYADLMEQYENPIEHTCDVREVSRGFLLTASILKGCVRRHGNQCAPLWNHWLRAKETSTTAG